MQNGIWDPLPAASAACLAFLAPGIGMAPLQIVQLIATCGKSKEHAMWPPCATLAVAHIKYLLEAPFNLARPGLPAITTDALTAVIPNA